MSLISHDQAVLWHWIWKVYALKRGQKNMQLKFSDMRLWLAVSASAPFITFHFKLLQYSFSWVFSMYMTPPLGIMEFLMKCSACIQAPNDFKAMGNYLWNPWSVSLEFWERCLCLEEVEKCLSEEVQEKEHGGILTIWELAADQVDNLCKQ